MGVLSSAFLGVANVVLGWTGGSTSAIAAGLEFFGDVLASALVFVGMAYAARPADEDHPYGHGRIELVAGLIVGIVLILGGIAIGYRSLQQINAVHSPPQLYTIVPLATAIAVRVVTWWMKLHYGRLIHSSSLQADAWNDAVDVLSASAALGAVLLARSDPSRFLAADHYGGCIVAIVVILTGLRVSRDSLLELMDTMPGEERVQQLRDTAMTVPGVRGIEKCFARKTGLQYHVDLHLEVDPEMTVRDSHDLATQVRFHLREQLDWVADVLVHVEPAPLPAPTADDVTH